MITLCVLCLYLTVHCNGYKILAIFPYNGRSHHIYHLSLVEELARRQHDVTVIDYHPVKKLPNLRQISLQGKDNSSDQVNIEEHLEALSVSDLWLVFSTAEAFKYIANTNCKKLMKNQEVQDLIKTGVHYDLVIAEQFVTDCGLAIAYKLNAPAIGMTAHILMPWTYSRLGASNHPAYVPNHFFASGTQPNLLETIKSAIENFVMNFYYAHVIQSSDQDIVKEVYPDTPPLEELGKNMSLILLNQYFPLTGPRLYGPNVIEVGGLHVNENAAIEDKSLQRFLDSADTGVIYISFGSVATNFPRKITDAIIKFVTGSSMKFVWKTDLSGWKPPSNVFVGQWMPQKAILCHPKVVGFISHSGMLSTTEAVHCGVPIVGVPLFGDQFANAQSTVEAGIGVSVDILTLNKQILDHALKTILQEKYQKKANDLSRIWKDRPLSPMDTAIFWIEYVARNKGAVHLQPPTVDLPLYSYWMIDVILSIVLLVMLLSFVVVKLLLMIVKLVQCKNQIKGKSKKN